MSEKPTRPVSALPPSSQSRTASRARPASALPGASAKAPSAHSTATGATKLGRPPRAAAAAATAAAAAPVSSSAIHETSTGGQSEMAYFQEQVYRLQREQQALKEKEQQETTEYRRELRRFYNGNAVLRNIITAAERRARHDGELSAEAAATVTEAEVQHLQYRMNLAHRRRNRLVHDLRVATSIVDGETAAANEVVSRGQPTPAEMVANRPAFLRKHRLERRLNEILTQQQTIDIVVKGYTHHLGELHTEGLHYDAQMQTVEKELRDRHRDQMQLVTLFRNAKKEFQTSEQECRTFLAKFEAGRATKDSALREKRAAVERQFSVTSEQANRLIVLEQQIEDEAQLMESAENVEAELEAERLSSRNALAVLSGGAGAGAGRAMSRGNASVQDEEKLSAYEKLFRTLMEKAKVTAPDQLVDVFETELQAQVQLINEVESRRLACAQLREEVQMLKAKVDEAQLCGLPCQPAATPALEAELVQFTHEAQTRLTQSLHHQQQTELDLTELVRRLNEVSQLMSGYRADVAIPPLQTSKDALFLLHTAVLTQKVLALADETVHVRATHEDGDGADEVPATVRSTQLIVPANNIRVPLETQDPNSASSKRGGGGLRRTSHHSGGAVAGMSSKAGARLLEMRRASRGGGAGRPSVGSLSITNEAVQGLSDNYGLVREPSTSLTHLPSASESSEDDSGAVAGPGGVSSPLSSTTAPRRSGGSARKHPMAGPTEAAAAMVTEDDPLHREEIKNMSEALLRRQRKREEQEQRRRDKTGL